MVYQQIRAVGSSDLLHLPQSCSWIEVVQDGGVVRGYFFVGNYFQRLGKNGAIRSAVEQPKRAKRRLILRGMNGQGDRARQGVFGKAECDFLLAEHDLEILPATIYLPSKYSVEEDGALAQTRSTLRSVRREELVHPIQFALNETIASRGNGVGCTTSYDCQGHG